MAPHVGRTVTSGGEQPETVTAADQMLTALHRLRQHIEENCDYVGASFPGGARRIFYGEKGSARSMARPARTNRRRCAMRASPCSRSRGSIAATTDEPTRRYFFARFLALLLTACVEKASSRCGDEVRRHL